MDKLTNISTDLIVIIYVFLPYLIIFEIGTIFRKYKLEKSKISLYLYAAIYILLFVIISIYLNEDGRNYILGVNCIIVCIYFIFSLIRRFFRIFK